MLSRYKKIIITRCRSTLLLLLVFISTITTLPILQSADVGATGLVDSMASTSKIKSLIYFKALSYCFRSHAVSISLANATSGKWFSDSSTANVGVYMGTELNGVVNCNSLATGALKL